MFTGDCDRVRSTLRVRDTLVSFVKDMTEGMHLSKPQRKHLTEYVMGLMLPPETRRKSVNSINELIGGGNQSSLNRFLNRLDPVALRDAWISYLKKVIGNREVYLITDDTLLDHEDSTKMEGVASFFDHANGRYVNAHQFVTSVLVIAETGEIVPFVLTPYRKVEEFLGGCECKNCMQIPHRFSQLGAKKCRCGGCHVEDFKTKNVIAREIQETAYRDFNVVGRTFDSWYLSDETTIDRRLYVSELKSNRWINPSHAAVKFSDLHSGKYRRSAIRKAGWRKIEDYAKELLKMGSFADRTDSTGVLNRFGQYCQARVCLHSGDRISLLILYDRSEEKFKYLVSNILNITPEKMLYVWGIRWSIEEFHKDAKDLGLGEYQLRKLHTVLIHGQITYMAYSLLKSLAASGTSIFGRCLKTIGECSRKLKALLFFVPRLRLKWTCT